MKVLLVDGMAVLVRSAKAAATIKPLSWHGVLTGPLMMFAQSMTAALAWSDWTHVVVAWEGIPERNWRRALYPAYKSNRPRRLGDDSALSQDEELAREFCVAAGILQDWHAEFEGDDVIAAWWRAFRANLPDAPVTILTGDQDLIQLCDEQTTCMTGQEGITTAQDVREIFGVEPARMPLLRALAGDPSDGIPGARGIGFGRAEGIARAEGSPLEVIWGHRPLFGTNELLPVIAWYAISELRDPVRRPELDTGEKCSRARWEPLLRPVNMAEFLAKYGLARLGARLEAGKLPWPPVLNKEPI